jgi:hypothetical protein
MVLVGSSFDRGEDFERHSAAAWVSTAGRQ